MTRLIRCYPSRLAARAKRWWLPTAGASLLGASLLTPFTLQSCTITHAPGGGWDISFGPDMVINAAGLEEAKDQIFDLWQACLGGFYTRPCTPQEIDQIAAAYSDCLGKKAQNSSSGGRHAAANRQ